MRSLPFTHPAPARSRRAWRGVVGLHAIVACLLALLQLVSALHFILVPHTFSAALGGIVHVHGEARRSLTATPARPSSAFTTGTPSCTMDLCPYAADARGNTLLGEPARVSAASALGEVSLLARPSASLITLRRALRSAPKTSPPV